MKCLLVLVSTALAVFGAAPIAQWRTTIDVQRRSQAYETAVCPDGWMYVTDGEGSVARISAAGRVEGAQHAQTGFEGVVRLNCGPDNSLWVAGQARLARYRHDLTGRLSLAADIQPQLSIGRLAASDRQLYVNNRSGLHIVDFSGRRVSSFARVSPFYLPLDGDTGLPIWDPQSRQLIFVARYSYEVQVFDESGRRLDVRDNAPVIRPVRIRPRQVGAVTGVARLRDGRLVVQLSGNPGEPADTHLFLDIYDAELNLLEESVPSPDGYLVTGGTADALFFQKMTLSGLVLTRARLE